MTSTNDNLERSRQKIINQCDAQIAWYEKTKSSTRTLHLSLTISTIVLSSLTPVLILWSDLPKPIQALPSALAAMTVALDRAFRPRENYARMSYFAEALKSEKIRFETRTTQDYRQDLDEFQSIENFVTRVDSLMKSEISEWRALSGASQDSEKIVR